MVATRWLIVVAVAAVGAACPRPAFADWPDRDGILAAHAGPVMLVDGEGDRRGAGVLAGVQLRGLRDDSDKDLPVPPIMVSTPLTRPSFRPETRCTSAASSLRESTWQLQRTSCARQWPKPARPASHGR